MVPEVDMWPLTPRDKLQVLVDRVKEGQRRSLAPRGRICRVAQANDLGMGGISHGYASKNETLKVVVLCALSI